ncbi:MAG TPA: hypothetical protein DDZ19_07785 [Flavobacteriales bacterium]|nr:hypothetical protein [Flavobacteriales bacterium]
MLKDEKSEVTNKRELNAQKSFMNSVFLIVECRKYTNQINGKFSPDPIRETKTFQLTQILLQT